MLSPLSFYRAQTDRAKSIIVFATVVATATFVFLFSHWQMGNVAETMMRPYEHSQKLIQEHLDSLPKPALLTVGQFKTFKTQQKILAARKAHYLELSSLFFRNYYGVLILTMLFSCIGGVVLFIVINKGWGATPPPLRALFLAILMVVTFCGFFPSVFKQQENFNQNIGSYMNYTKAEANIMGQLSSLQNIRSYTISETKKINDKDSVLMRLDTIRYLKDADSLINLNTATINNLTNYILTIDAREIKSIGEVYKTIMNDIGRSKDTSKTK